MNGQQLPIVNISSLLSPTSTLSERLKTARELDSSIKEFGFLYITGYSIESTEILQTARKFFQLDQSIKQKYSITLNDNARGYQRLGQNTTKYKSDYHEGIDLYSEVGMSTKDGTLMGKNINPVEVEGYQQVVEKYVKEMLHLGACLMRGIALGLGLPEDYFKTLHDPSFWCMRMIGYPPLKSNSNSDGGISCGEHCDYGMLTILHMDECKSSLQVKTRQDEWLKVSPIENCFLVNIGDMLTVMTNGIYKSTLHRVIHGGDRYRISVPFFFEPRWDAIIEPIEKCVLDSGGEIKCKSVMYGDHLMSKVSNNFDLSA